MNYFHSILSIIGIITFAIFFQSDTLQNVEARSISSFSWQIDEKYHREGFVDFIVSNDSHNSLPVTVHSISGKPITLTLHTTSNFDQMGKAKLPRGVDAFFEPEEFRLEPNQTKQVDLIINVDKNAPSNLYDLQIVGTWKEAGKIPDFMGSSIRLHVGRDFGIQKIPVNMLSPPLKIWKESYNEENFTINDVPCRNDFVLVVKTSNGNPACVKQETREKLIQREWARFEMVNLGPTDNYIVQDQTIILNKGIDDYDSGTSFNPIYKKLILGKNNIVTWFNAKQEPVHIQSDEQLFDGIIQPQESFSFAFDSVGIHRYHDPINWKRGTVFVSTNEIESSNLHPAKLLMENQDDIAKTIMLSAINDDSITKTRLDNTIMNAYVTKRGADIIVPESLCIMCTLSEYSPIEYRYGMTSPLYHPQSADDALDFAKRFMNDIGYKMDGTEWIDSVDYGNYVQVKIQQKVQGWIVPNQFVSFTFFKDNTTISMGRWYDDASTYQFSLSQDDAKEIAKKYMEKEVNSNITLKEYKYKFEDIGQAQVIIAYDKPLYVIPVGFESTLQQEFNNGHCGNPEYFGAMVLVEGKTGAVIGWDYPGCE